MKLIIILNTNNTILDPVLKIPFFHQSECQAVLNEFPSRCDIADSSCSNILEVVNYVTNTNRELLYEAEIFFETLFTLLDPVLKIPFVHQSNCQAVLNEFPSRCDIAESSCTNILELVDNVTNTNRELFNEADNFLKHY
jgi:hypothetical protein